MTKSKFSDLVRWGWKSLNCYKRTAWWIYLFLELAFLLHFERLCNNILFLPLNVCIAYIKKKRPDSDIIPSCKKLIITEIGSVSLKCSFVSTIKTSYQFKKVFSLEKEFSKQHLAVGKDIALLLLPLPTEVCCIHFSWNHISINGLSVVHFSCSLRSGNIISNSFEIVYTNCIHFIWLHKI